MQVATGHGLFFGSEGSNLRLFQGLDPHLLHIRFKGLDKDSD